MRADSLATADRMARTPTSSIRPSTAWAPQGLCLKEEAMNENVTRDRRFVSKRIHPAIYIAMIALVLWLIVSVWEFAGGGYVDYLLAIVSGFFLMVLAMIYALWRTWRKQQAPGVSLSTPKSFRRWASDELDTWQDRVKGINAAIEILLPIAAVAFGMTAFGLVLHFARP